MLILNNYLGKELKILQQSFWKKEFFLLDGEKIEGKLFSKKLFNDLFECEIGDKEFEFYKKNILGKEIFIREKGKQLPFATFTSNFFFTSGELKLLRGRKVLIKLGTFKNNAYLYESENKILFQLICKFSLKEKCTLTIENKSEILDEYSWLPLFVFYLLTISKDAGIVFH